MKFSHGAMAPRGASDGKRRGGARLSVSGQRLESTRSGRLMEQYSEPQSSPSTSTVESGSTAALRTESAGIPSDFIAIAVVDDAVTLLHISATFNQQLDSVPNALGLSVQLFGYGCVNTLLPWLRRHQICQLRKKRLIFLAWWPSCGLLWCSSQEKFAHSVRRMADDSPSGLQRGGDFHQLLL